MNFKKSPLTIQDKNTSDLEKANDHPTIADLIKEQNISSDKSKSIHYRRDLDSLG